MKSLSYFVPLQLNESDVMNNDNKEQDIKVCSISVMDTVSDPDITFDSQGICNYYYDFKRRQKQRLFNDSQLHLERILSRIRKEGKGREYDCLIGVSGGVDSTYLAYLTKEFGLRPLAVHFDNGWNSELSVKNIENVLNKLGIDLQTFVVDWEEFKSLQLAFLRASTPDGEIPTDHAIIALLFRAANKTGIKYILNGNNVSTEGVMPKTWSYGHIDFKYIQTINKLFGTRKLKDYPHITPGLYAYFSFAKQIKMVSLLNYYPYNKEAAMAIIKDKLGWKYYGGKHYESIYTRFFQGYMLPIKFGIDKRKAHLSTLIFSGQVTKEQALQQLMEPVYPEALLREDLDFVKKKLNLSSTAFDEIMKLPALTYRNYPNTSKVLDRLRIIQNKLRAKEIIYS